MTGHKSDSEATLDALSVFASTTGLGYEEKVLSQAVSNKNADPVHNRPIGRMDIAILV